MKAPIILAYAGNRSLISITPDDASRLTHVNLAFGLVGPDGRMDPSKLTNIEYTRQIRAWNPALKFVLSVGGWGAGGFSEMAMTDAGRRAFAASCKEYLDAHDLDGVDIDWEYPCNDSANIGADPKDKQNFTYLLQAIRDAIGKDRIVSIAAGAGDYFVRDTEMDKVAAICDYVQLMTYDMRSGFCSQSGHHTALFAGEGDDSGRNTRDTVNMFRKAGVPGEKTVIGAAFYARYWDNVPPENHGLLQETGSVAKFGPRYSELVESYIDQGGFTRLWDEKARAPFLYGNGCLYSYDDPTSLSEKCEYLKKEGLLGIMYWEHGCDQTHTLLKAIADALEK